MSNTLENQVKALVARHFGISPSKVRMDDSFVGELGGDALDMVELGWEIEAAGRSMRRDWRLVGGLGQTAAPDSGADRDGRQEERL